MTDATDNEVPSAGKHSSGSGTTFGYKVEVRTTYHTPTVIGAEFVIDNKWRELPISRGATAWGQNVPVSYLDGRMIDHGLVPYAAAEAHRWGLMAFLDAQRPMGSLCVETRLVEVEFKYSHTTHEVGVTEPAQSPRRVVVKPRFAKAMNPTA